MWSTRNVLYKEIDMPKEKGWENRYNSSANKKARAVTIVSDRLDFKTRSLMRNK